MDINTAFTRELLKKAHAMVKDAKGDDIHLWKDAWTYHFHGEHWEFHGPDEFYWHGSAGDAYEARYKGWMAWLEKFHPDVLERLGDD